MAQRGLCEIVELRPRDLLEYLLPVLLTSPVQITAAKALAGIADVPGACFHLYFNQIIPAVVTELSSISDKIELLEASCASSENISEADLEDKRMQIEFESSRLSAVQQAAASVVGSVTTVGVSSFISEVAKQIEHESSVKKRRWGCWLVQQFVSKSKADYTDYVLILLKYVLSRCAEMNRPLLQAVCECLQAMASHISLDELMSHVEFIRNCVSSTASAARHRTGTGNLLTATGEFLLPLLTIPKSLDPFLTILLHGLMNGSVPVREVAAETIGELAKMTDPAVLKPVLIKATGPLIRVIGDRFPSNVKGAILQTLCILLDKGGQSLKAFVPQLQTTFIKSLNDASRDVRSKATTALGKLISISMRIDPLLTELSAICMQADGNAVKASVYEAILSVLTEGADKASPTAMDRVQSVCMNAVPDEDDTVRSARSRCLGMLSAFMGPAQVSGLLIDLLGSGAADTNSTVQCGRLVSIGAVLQCAGPKAMELREEAFAFLLKGLQDDRIVVKTAACRAVGLLMRTPPQRSLSEEDRKGPWRAAGQAAVHTFATSLAECTSDSGSSEMRIYAISAIKQAAKNYYGATSQQIKSMVPPLLLATKDINLMVRYAADRALKHLSEAPSSSSSNAAGGFVTSPAMTAYIATNIAAAIEMKDYIRRILSKLPNDSEDEGNV